MRQVWCLAFLSVLIGSGVATAQLPEVVYEWGVPGNLQQWQTWGSHNQPVLPNYNTATISAATGDLVVTETGTAGKVGKELWIFDNWGRPREDADPINGKGGLDATGLQYIEMDIRHNHPTETVYVDFLTQFWNGESWWGGSDGTAVMQGAGGPPPAWPVGPGSNTIRFPISQLPTRNQGFIDLIWLVTRAHETVGNVTWTISQVRTAGTPLTERNIVTNNLGSPDDGIDGAFPLNSADVLAIVGNPGTTGSQEGLTRNPSGSGSLQWTDKGGTGATGSESGASIGWGSGAGWRNAQPGDPTSGNGYNERIANFSGYDRMTVTISALDTVNSAGTVGIEPLFMVQAPSEAAPPTLLPSQNLTTDGQYHDLVYDLSSVTFLKNVWHWGLDMAPHPNNIVFNIDNIRLWNSTAVPVGTPGDYNNDGKVDAADYVLWRNGGPLQNDPNPGNPTAQYNQWKANFGKPPGAGSGSALGAVPEPSAAMLLLTAMVGWWWKRRGV